jgi:hypothetical protein
VAGAGVEAPAGAGGFGADVAEDAAVAAGFAAGDCGSCDEQAPAKMASAMDNAISRIFPPVVSLLRRNLRCFRGREDRVHKDGRKATSR